MLSCSASAGKAHQATRSFCCSVHVPGWLGKHYQFLILGLTDILMGRWIYKYRIWHKEGQQYIITAKVNLRRSCNKSRTSTCGEGGTVHVGAPPCTDVGALHCQHRQGLYKSPQMKKIKWSILGNCPHIKWDFIAKKYGFILNSHFGFQEDVLIHRYSLSIYNLYFSFSAMTWNGMWVVDIKVSFL